MTANAFSRKFYYTKQIVHYQSWISGSKWTETVASTFKSKSCVFVLFILLSWYFSMDSSCAEMTTDTDKHIPVCTQIWWELASG